MGSLAPGRHSGHYGPAVAAPGPPSLRLAAKGLKIKEFLTFSAAI
jgi:hypothetical protein